MATGVLDLTEQLMPDPSSTTGPAWLPSANYNANDLHKAIEVLVFPDGSVKIVASCRFILPTDFASGAVFKIRWYAIPTSGDAVVTVDYNCPAVGESADPSSFTRSLSATETVPATSKLIKETTLAATDGDFAAGDTVMVSIGRNLASGSDTLADNLLLLSARFEYTTT